LTRVRENQRRHRARRKDYIATLEEKLAETEKQLAEARAEIAALKRERDVGVVVLPCAHGVEREEEEEEKEEKERRDQERGKAMLRIDGAVGEVEEMDGVEEEEEEEEHGGVNGDGFCSSLEQDDGLALALPQDTAFLTDDFSLLDTLPSPIPDIPELPMAGPPPCCEEIPSTPPPDPTDPECSTCKTRPAPLPSESTTLCAQAYVMISQQNFRDVDATTIRLWLYQGYRRAQREGEGCRVENGALFRLLDFISGV
jgi:hypothetical protein